MHFSSKQSFANVRHVSAFVTLTLVACAHDIGSEAPGLALGVTGGTTAQERAVVLDSSGLGLREPALMNPAYVRNGASGAVLLLDTGRSTIFEYRGNGKFVTRYGRKGHGSGQLWTPIAMDVSPEGTVWVVDAGNAKVVGFRADGALREFPIDFQPAGIAAVSDDDIWIAGDLRSSLFVRLDSSGRRRGVVGVPADTGRTAFRGNQGSAARGEGVCAVLWAYSYRSRLECYNSKGARVWRVSGPTTVEWPKDADPFRMSASDRLAFLDIAVSQGKVFALFLGNSGVPKSRHLEVFDESDGAYLGSAYLTDSATHVAISPARITVVEAGGEQLIPHLRIYSRTRDGVNE